MWKELAAQVTRGEPDGSEMVQTERCYSYLQLMGRDTERMVTPSKRQKLHQGTIKD